MRSAILIVAACYRTLVLGRFMVGIGIGISAVVVPVYLGEVAPAQVHCHRVVVLASLNFHSLNLASSVI